MKLMDALRKRRAVREFAPDPVSGNVLRELVEAAALAPSHMNLQPWVFAIVSDPVVVANLGERAHAYLERNLNERSPFFVERHELKAMNHGVFYNAPALIAVCSMYPGELSEYACAMAAYNIMLTAHSFGLGSCWVSHAQPWLNTAEGREALGIPARSRVVAPVIVGCPAGEPMSIGRFSPEIVWVPDATPAAG